MNAHHPNSGTPTRPRRRFASSRLFGAVVFAAALTACSSGAEVASGTESSEPNESTEPTAAVSTDGPIRDLKIDRSTIPGLAFDQPITPFETPVVPLYADGAIDVVDEATGKVVATYQSDLQPIFVVPMQARGAIYLLDERGPGLRSFTRIDAAGEQRIEFESIGWIDFRPFGPVPAVFVRGLEENQSQLHLLNDDGSIDTLTFDDGVFVRMFDERIVVTDAQHNGDTWLLDAKFETVDSRRLGQLQNVPILRTDGALYVNRDGERLGIDLDTWEETPEMRRREIVDGVQIYEADSFRVEVADESMWIVDTESGAVLAETLVAPARDVSAFEHPDGSHALIAIRTCISEEGDTCELEAAAASSQDDGGNEGDGEGDDYVGDEPFVAPAYLDLYRYDLADNTITPIDTPRLTGLAVHAWSDGWFAGGVDGSTTTIFGIDGMAGAEVSVFEEVPNDGQYWAQQYVYPVGQSSLAVVDYTTSELYLATETGVVVAEGAAFEDKQAWLANADKFATLG